MDAQQIRAVQAGHQAALASQAALKAAEEPFVNRRDPARALGPDGKPAVSRRAPKWEDVPDEKWNDWRWQLSNRVNDLGEIEEILNLTDDERLGLSAPDKFRVDITPYFISLIDPNDPNDPIRRQVIPTAREHQAFTGVDPVGLELGHYIANVLAQGLDPGFERLGRRDPGGHRHDLEAVAVHLLRIQRQRVGGYDYGRLLTDPRVEPEGRLVEDKRAGALA